MRRPTLKTHLAIVPPDVPSPEPLARVSDRVRALHETVRATQPSVCAERALLVTEYHRKRANRRKPAVIQKAEALRHILSRKRTRIYPGELLVGCFTSHRVGGGLFPELHGLLMFEDLFRFETRETNPLSISRADRRKLLTRVLPFWLPRFMPLRIRPLRQALRLMWEQLSSPFYLLNELGGISHFVPNYQALITGGTSGLRRDAVYRLRELGPESPEADFLKAVQIACDALEAFADSYRRQATELAETEGNSERRAELLQIAETCARVPIAPATTFREALQSILFAQIAINLESLDNAVSPGRLDQILWPLYERDLAAGRIDQQGALELLGCFAVKLCEIVPVFSKRVRRFHGGLFNGQAVVVGGTDREGGDVTNELSFLMLTLMEQLRTRQPNYQARVHANSPAPYRAEIAKTLASGSASPAVYNDDVLVPLLKSRGMTEGDARDYAAVGCVEPTSASRSYLSTDAALFNVPCCLELALNQGRQFGSRKRIGAATPPARACRSTDDLVALFRRQLEHVMPRLFADLRLVEEANARCHPTPLSSMLIEGCIANGLDASAGGARYNGSGVQGVGVIDVGDSLAAIDQVVFIEGNASMSEVIDACRDDFRNHEVLRARLRKAPKYGNNDGRADAFSAEVMSIFAEGFRGKGNSRGGDIVAGFYSVTAHQAYGAIVGALPSGRRAGQPFSSGVSPTSGVKRVGPTAALLSAAALPLHQAGNGVNFNLELAPWLVEGKKGQSTLRALIDGALSAGCMQFQINVMDPAVLLEARDHPELHPGLLVRVSGYSAYFNDLSAEMKQEIIDRTMYDRHSSP